MRMKNQVLPNKPDNNNNSGGGGCHYSNTYGLSSLFLESLEVLAAKTKTFTQHEGKFMLHPTNKVRVVEEADLGCYRKKKMLQ